MTCDSCEEDFHNRCRANESSCIDGVGCPDYIEHCECEKCKEKE